MKELWKLGLVHSTKILQVVDDKDDVLSVLGEVNRFLSDNKLGEDNSDEIPFTLYVVGSSRVRHKKYCSIHWGVH